ncbi:hypothetical protein ACWC0A_05760 [Streptomyces scopuliridis]
MVIGLVGLLGVATPRETWGPRERAAAEEADKADLLVAGRS